MNRERLMASIIDPEKKYPCLNSLDIQGKLIKSFNSDYIHNLNLVLESTLDLIPGNLALYNRFDFDGQTVISRYGLSFPEGLRRKGRFSERIRYEEFVKADRPFIICSDLCASRYIQSGPDIKKHHLRAYIGYRVILNGDIIGSLEVFHKQPNSYEAEHVRIMELMVGLVSFIEERQQVEKNLKQKLISRSIEKRLDESEALNNQMFQLSAVAIYRVDLVRQRFVKVNDHMCRATGYSEEELLAMSPMELLTPSSQALFRRRCLVMAAGQPVSSEVEFEIITKDGTLEWCQLHIRHLYENGMITGANVVAHFITEQKKIEAELDNYRKELESLVEARTSALAKANEQLREEIKNRVRTAQKLRASSERLKEMNTAMRVLLDKRMEDHQRAEERIRMSLKELIDPYLTRLENSGLKSNQNQLLQVIRMNLDEVVGSSLPEITSKYHIFSPNELQVVNLIRKGKTTKEIARLLNLSTRTVETYRNSIRKKLGLKNKKVNLRTYLASI